MALKELHRLFVFFCRSLSLEHTQIPSLSGFRIFLTRIKAITTRLQLPNHSFLLLHRHTEPLFLSGYSTTISWRNYLRGYFAAGRLTGCPRRHWQATRPPYNSSFTAGDPCRASAPLAGSTTKEKLPQPVRRDRASDEC
jgi:hypothetical protein